MSDMTHKWDNMVILFGKALTIEPGLLEDDKDNTRGPLWIALGYFDTLQIYPLPQEEGARSWMERIYHHDLSCTKRLDGKFYLHPLHIMAQPGEDAERYDQFWRGNCPYTCVTLLQGAREAVEKGGDGVPPYQRLKQDVQLRLRTQPGGSPRSGAAWVAYQTMNLSDLVIIWKSSSICNILESIQALYHHPHIGDLHTIPGVLHTCVQRAAAGIDLCPEPVDERIPFVHTRYLVQDAHAAATFFRSYSEDTTCFFTTGTEDLSRVSLDLPAKKLIEGLACQLQGLPDAPKPQDAFLECETHLGVPDKTVLGEDRSGGDSRLTARCQVLQEHFQDFLRGQAAADIVNSSWHKSAGELFNALLDMSRNAVSDGFCYLILDSAVLFCEKLKHMEHISSSQLGRIQRFLRGWGVLMEQALRLDGKFSQQPGFSPALCDIPSSLLEFYLAFTARSGRAMQIGAGVREQSCLLLVPKLCRRIKVEPTFEDENGCGNLLFVDIPLELLYDPHTALCHLCHEISHYCGDVWRCREFRRDMYLHVCARELALELGLFDPRSVELVYNDLSKGLSGDWSAPVLKILNEKTVETAVALLRDEKTFMRWIHSEWDGTRTMDEYLAEITAFTVRKEMLRAVENSPDEPHGVFFWDMRDFAALFKECYADASTIFTLSLTPEEYVGMALKEQCLYAGTLQATPEETAAYDHDYRLLVERWSAVFLAAYGSIPIPVKEPWPEPLCAFAKDVEGCMGFITRSEKDAGARFTDRYHRRGSINFLIKYLKHCLEEMQQASLEGQGRQKAALDVLREAFGSIARDYDMSCAACYRVIAAFRADSLNQP